MDIIFVSIASYRDPELEKTIRSLIEGADLPEKLRVVVFEQNAVTDPSVSGMFPKKTVKVVKTHHLNAKGPVWARYVIQTHYSDEEYYMQIDSHTRVTRGWDTTLKNMLRLLPEPAVLTQYPSEYKKEGLDSRLRSGLYIQGFSPNDGFPRLQSNYTKDVRGYPYTSKAWGGCFSFSKGSIVKDAPYDPDLKFLFFGEEFDITLRLFTRGYYFFSPHVNVVYTLFDRSYRRTYWQDIGSKKIGTEELRARTRLMERMYRVGGVLGLGTSRSLGDYEKFARVDLKKRKLLDGAKALQRPNNRNLIR